ncbi:SH3 domain-containing protein [Stigmatella sp. ncwal1]|uniref:SH3 domain-containing protein n=1 Tax=Stigmatella ashevillensis TaxID=2995309 RepID=A0ABT5D1V2_9BACT|nr:SH3 domain-containing protein [Stigmatella ashevillena]MDC0707113.1 SH3 domain-containing protein [Stigmatella ashevillena]
MRAWNRAVRPWAGMLLGVLLLTACGDAQEMVVLHEALELRDDPREEAPVAGKLPLGTRVKVQPSRPWEDAAWRRVMTPQGMRWTKLEGLAPFPLQGEARFVWQEELPVHSTPDPSARIVETLKLGEDIHLLSAQVPGAAGYTGVIRQGTLLGFAEASGLGTEKPTVENLLASARGLLKQGDFPQAMQRARSARALAEGAGRSGALVDALERAGMEPESLQAEFEFSEKARGTETPRSGTKGWVIPSRVHLREGADLRDTIFTVLSADAAVEVLDIQPPWAHVALATQQTSWMAVDLGDFAEVRSGKVRRATFFTQQRSQDRGYLPISSLQAKRLSPAEQQAKALTLEPGDARLELLKRAVALADPGELSQVAPALIDDAFQEERYRLAVAAALRLKAAGPKNGATARKEWKLEAVTSLYGCTGHPLEARVEQVEFALGAEFPKPQGTVCAQVSGLESPCDVCLSNLSDYDAEARQHVLRDKAGVDTLLSEHEEIITQHLKDSSRLENLYAKPSRMRVSVKPGSGLSSQTLYLFELPLEVNRYQDKAVLTPAFREARMAEVLLPLGSGEGRWEYWMSTLQWEDSVHGALFAGDATAAWKVMQDFAQALKKEPETFLGRNESQGVVYALHISRHCGKCPTRQKPLHGR